MNSWIAGHFDGPSLSERVKDLPVPNVLGYLAAIGSHNQLRSPGFRGNLGDV